jgi:hypothetical protein
MIKAGELYLHAQFWAEVRGRCLDLSEVVTVFNEIRRADVPCVGGLSAEEIAHLAAFRELPGGVDLKGRATALDLLKVGGLGRGVPWGAAAGKS